jgi:hypothetical protein
MAFKYVGEKPLSVEDDATGASLRMLIFEYREEKLPFYRYQHGGIEFDFPVHVVYEDRVYETKRGPTRAKLPVAAYVNSQDIERGLAPRMSTRHKMSARSSLSSDDRGKLYRSVQEALFTLLTNGGVHLKFVPDFKVEILLSGGHASSDVSRP